MIVKNGRIYLWENNISEADLYIQVGEGGNTNQQVKISNTKLNKPLVTGTGAESEEADVDIWYSTEDLAVDSEDWEDSLTDITNNVSIKDYLDTDTRKITIFIKIVPKKAAIQLGEMGLFVKVDQPPLPDPLPDPLPEPVPDILISKTMMHKQTLSNSETKILQYTINI